MTATSTRPATTRTTGSKTTSSKATGVPPLPDGARVPPTAPTGPAVSSNGPGPIAKPALDLLAPKAPWVPPTPSTFERTVGITVGTVSALASPLLIVPLTRAFRPLAMDPAALEPKPDELGDPGWFGPDSVAWKVHADGARLIAGIAAFALQALHPRAMAGVAEHSAFAEDFLGRTQRTGDFVQGVVYGSSTEADRLCRMVHKIHGRVVGTAPDGRPYSANDPDLLHWVHITEYAAIAAANRRFGLRPMSRSELDTYVGEVSRVGIATGVIDPPTDWNGINAALERHRPNLATAEYGAAAISFLERPPIVPDVGQPVWQALWNGAVACLPPVAHDLLRLKMPSDRDLAVTRALLRTLGAPGGTTPRLVAARKRLGLPQPT